METKNPGQWYFCLKRITSHDQEGGRINIDEISHLSEMISDKFSSIPNEYKELEDEDVSIPPF